MYNLYTADYSLGFLKRICGTLATRSTLAKEIGKPAKVFWRELRFRHTSWRIRQSFWRNRGIVGLFYTKSLFSQEKSRYNKFAMRIWDIPVRKLCRSHLLGEHRELHAIWSILIHHKKGYSRHPETLRWKGKLRALYLRHTQLIQEMQKRGYLHKSPLDQKLACGSKKQTLFVNTPKEQLRILKNKHCNCKL